MAFAVKFILVTLSMILANVCWTMYFIEVDKRQPIPAGIWGSAIILFGAFTTVHYVEDHRLLVAALIGSFVGTASTVYYKKKKEQNDKK
jgi:peptidoglycan biosynthesis protein MviN/MurJ (putative lipid II flippase)